MQHEDKLNLFNEFVSKRNAWLGTASNGSLGRIDQFILNYKITREKYVAAMTESTFCFMLQDEKNEKMAFEQLSKSAFMLFDTRMLAIYDSGDFSISFKEDNEKDAINVLPELLKAIDMYDMGVFKPKLIAIPVVLVGAIPHIVLYIIEQDIEGKYTACIFDSIAGAGYKAQRQIMTEVLQRRYDIHPKSIRVNNIKFNSCGYCGSFVADFFLYIAKELYIANQTNFTFSVYNMMPNIQGYGYKSPIQQKQMYESHTNFIKDYVKENIFEKDKLNKINMNDLFYYYIEESLMQAFSCVDRIYNKEIQKAQQTIKNNKPAQLTQTTQPPFNPSTKSNNQNGSHKVDLDWRKAMLPPLFFSSCTTLMLRSKFLKEAALKSHSAKDLIYKSRIFLVITIVTMLCTLYLCNNFEYDKRSK